MFTLKYFPVQCGRQLGSSLGSENHIRPGRDRYSEARVLVRRHNGELHLGGHCKVKFKRSVRIILVTSFVTLQGGAIEVGKELSVPVI